MLNMLNGLIVKVWAQEVSTDVPANPLGDRFGGGLSEVFAFIINIVIGTGIALTVVFLGIAGIKYMTSQGDPKAKETAQNALTNAVIGFIVVIAAFTIKIVVGNILAAGAGGTVIENVTPEPSGIPTL